MKIIFLLTTIIFTFFIFSCEKEHIITPTEIKMGKQNSMIINAYDTLVVGEYNVAEVFNIDLNNDGLEDIQLESELWGSPAVGSHPASKIKSLHENALIHVYRTHDTTFLNLDSVVYMDDGEVNIAVYANNTCYRMDENDTILKISESAKVTALEKNEIITLNDKYIADTIKLEDDAYQFPPSFLEQYVDTTIYGIYSFYNNCYAFPQNKVKYIGIKLGNTSKLGWIKLSIFDMNKILILESAIQK